MFYSITASSTSITIPSLTSTADIGKKIVINLHNTTNDPINQTINAECGSTTYTSVYSIPAKSTMVYEFEWTNRLENGLLNTGWTLKTVSPYL